MPEETTPEQWAARIHTELNLIALDYGHDDIVSVHANEVATLTARLMAEFRDTELASLRKEIEELRAERRLTPTQRVVLGAVRDLIRKNGQPPTMQEIAAAAGLNAAPNAWNHLRALEREGFLRRKPNRARGIELVEETSHA